MNINQETTHLLERFRLSFNQEVVAKTAGLASIDAQRDHNESRLSDCPLLSVPCTTGNPMLNTFLCNKLNSNISARCSVV
jgi:hypothetical protein